MEEANRFLESTFLKDFNRRLPSAQRIPKAWRELPKPLDLDRIISFRYIATVGNDNTARLGGLVLDIPQALKKILFEAQGEARQLLNGLGESTLKIS